MAEGNAHVFQMKNITPIERGNGIRSIPLAGASTGAQNIATGMSIFPPGTAIPLHTHSSEEAVVLLEGKAVCEVNGQRYDLVPYDATYVPAGVPHRFINVGDGEMRITWSYGAVNTTRTFVETGETTGHLDSYAGRNTTSEGSGS